MPWYEGLLKNARRIVTSVKHSSQLKAKLLEVQVALGKEPVTVVQDVATRWWATYAMVQRMLVLQPYLNLMADAGHFSKKLTCDEWERLEVIEKVLKPFMAFQKLLEGQKYVTCSFLPSVVKLMRDHLSANAGVSPEYQFEEEIPNEADLCETERLSRYLLGFLNIHFGSGVDVLSENLTRGFGNRQKGIPILVYFAHALDPRFKHLQVGVPDVEKDTLWAQILLELVRIHPTPLPADPEPAHPAAIPDAAPAAAVPQADPVAANFESDDFYHQLQPVGTLAAPETVHDDVQALLTEELDRYRRVPILPFKDAAYEFNNPLAWWRDHESEFPNIARLARRILAIPATSAPSERVFSTAGLTIAKDRASLQPETADDLVFLHDITNLIPDFYDVVQL